MANRVDDRVAEAENAESIGNRSVILRPGSSRDVLPEYLATLPLISGHDTPRVPASPPTITSPPSRHGSTHTPRITPAAKPSPSPKPYASTFFKFLCKSGSHFNTRSTILATTSFWCLDTLALICSSCFCVSESIEDWEVVVCDLCCFRISSMYCRRWGQEVSGAGRFKRAGVGAVQLC